MVRDPPPRAAVEEYRWSVADAISPAATTLFRYSDRRLVRANTRFVDLVGSDEESVLGRTIDELGLVPEPVSRGLIQNALAQRGWIEQLTVPFTHHARGEILLSLSVCLVRHEGELCALTQVLDLTRERGLRSRSRASDERWRSVLRSLPDYVCTLDEHGYILDVNRLPEGLEEGDVIGHHYGGFLAAEDVPRVQAVIGTALASGEPQEYEAKVITGEREVEYHHRVVPIQDATGRPALVLVSTDVTQWRQMERQVAVADRRARAILDSTTDAFLHIDASGTVTEMNRHAERLLGAEAASVLGQDIWTRFPEARGTPLERSFWRVFASGRPAHFESFYPPLQKWFEVHAYRTPEGAAAYFRDTTARRADADRLRASEARFRSIVELARDVIFLGDADARFTYVSPSVSRVLGYEPVELLGVHLRDLLHPDDAALCPSEHFGEASKGESEGQNPLLRVRKRSGGYAHLELCGTALEGSEGGGLWVARDVSDRVLEEEQREEARVAAAHREKLSALGTLVAGVAHEINNPLSYLRGGAEFISLGLDELRDDEETPAFVRERLEELRRHEAALLRGADRIEHITRSLKRVARKSTGEREVLPLQELVDSALTVATPRIPSHVTVHRMFAGSPTVSVEGSEIAQVLLNLLFNAGEAVAEQVDGTLIVRTDVEADYAIVEVEDNGPGISEEVQPVLFTPFATTKSQGTGLGLSISLGIVETYGGQLTFRTEPGRGTVFRVALPLHKG